MVTSTLSVCQAQKGIYASALITVRHWAWHIEAEAGVTPLAECRLCNQDIVQRVQQVICFAFHDSRLLLQTCSEAKEQRKIVTLFYLD